MKKARFLRHRITGAVFPYNPHLAKRNKNVEPYNGAHADPVFEEVDATGTPDPEALGGLRIGAEADDQNDDGANGGAEAVSQPVMIGDVPIDEATKDQLEAYAKAAFGVDLDKRKSINALKDQVLKLIEKA